MDSKQIGNVTELEVLTYVTKMGYQVSLPFGDRERYDQIWDIGGKLLKIQVKTSSPAFEDGQVSLIRFKCRSKNMTNGLTVYKRYTSDQIDYFATMWEGQCYLVPVGECSTDKYLRFITPKNGQIKGVSFAKNYEVEEVLKEFD